MILRYGGEEERMDITVGRVNHLHDRVSKLDAEVAATEKKGFNTLPKLPQDDGFQ